MFAQEDDGSSLSGYHIDDFSSLQIKTQATALIFWYSFVKRRVQICDESYFTKSLIVFQDLLALESIDVFPVAVVGLGFIAWVNSHLH